MSPRDRARRGANRSVVIIQADPRRFRTIFTTADGDRIVQPGPILSALRTMVRREAPRPPRRGGGHTLVELVVTLTVMAVLTSFGIPRFVRSLEQSRVDIAATNLRAVWTAERLYWLKHQTYAVSLAALISDPADGENFLDPSLSGGTPTPGAPQYQCQVTAASATDFTATATRAEGGSWSGGLSITSTGSVSGFIQDPSGYQYTPSPSFQ